MAPLSSKIDPLTGSSCRSQDSAQFKWNASQLAEIVLSNAKVHKEQFQICAQSIAPELKQLQYSQGWFPKRFALIGADHRTVAFSSMRKLPTCHCCFFVSSNSLDKTEVPVFCCSRFCYVHRNGFHLKKIIHRSYHQIYNVNNPTELTNSFEFLQEWRIHDLNINTCLNGHFTRKMMINRWFFGLSHHFRLPSQLT